MQWLLILIIGCNCLAATPDQQSIHGKVVNARNEAAIGASIILTAHNKIVSGTMSGPDGKFVISYRTPEIDSLTLQISSIGFMPDTIPVAQLRDATELIVTLKEKSIEIGSVTVKSPAHRRSDQITMNQKELSEESRNSLVPTNPIGAIQQPQTVRVGSMHSSKLRVSGTSPSYYLNGTSIGQDPHHYGVFAIIPGPAVEKFRFYPHGTPAKYGRASVVEMDTPRFPEKRFQGEFDLSAVEATGLAMIGSDRWYVLGTLRKSVLDKLIEHIEYSSQRRTIPPTNFQDIVISSGIKLSDHFRLLYDQYDTRDFLDYQTQPTSLNAKGIAAFQHVGEQYFGSRLEGQGARWRLTLRTSVRSTNEKYLASSNGADFSSGIHVNLSGSQREESAGAEAHLLLPKTDLTFGQQIEYISSKRVDLVQHNWNFMPPDDASDNIFPYQNELNQLFGEYHAHARELNGATYISIKRHLAHIDLETGVRAEHFDRLARRQELLTRHFLTISTSENGRIELFYGMFAENPASRLLDPYQVLIQAYLSNLRAIRTEMVTCAYCIGPVTFEAFHKRMHYLPIIGPDNAAINAQGQVTEDFLQVQSMGKLIFTGGDVSLNCEKLFSSRMDLTCFYGYSKADKIIGSLTVPYELNAAHTFYINSRYHVSRVISLGCDVHLRSGLYYTPSYSGMANKSSTRYSNQYYQSILALENSCRFPTNFGLNLRLDLSFGETEIFLVVTNATNQSNPIIHNSDGYIYDAGILPMLGVKHSF